MRRKAEPLPLQPPSPLAKEPAEGPPLPYNSTPATQPAPLGNKHVDFLPPLPPTPPLPHYPSDTGRAAAVSSHNSVTFGAPPRPCHPTPPLRQGL